MDDSQIQISRAIGFYILETRALINKKIALLLIGKRYVAHV